MTHFTPGALWPDTSGTHINAHGGGILLHDNTYYWFGEHKIAGPLGNTAQLGVSVYSSTDLLHWTDRGIALSVSETPGHPIERGCILERPKVLFCPATGKFVMWFHLEPKGQGYLGALAAVAQADTPTGPYTFLSSFRPDANHRPQNGTPKTLSPAELAHLASLKMYGGPIPDYPLDLIYRRDLAGGQMSRDQTLFLDDNGLAYQIRASEENGTLHISQLAPDFLSTSGEWARALPGRFHEAPALFKHNATYYLLSSACTGWDPNPARLSSAPHPMGPWTEHENPVRGTPTQIATTFHSQAAFVLPLGENRFIFLADRWTPQNPIDARHIWLPIHFGQHSLPELHWHDQWNLDIFE